MIVALVMLSNFPPKDDEQLSHAFWLDVCDCTLDFAKINAYLVQQILLTLCLVHLMVKVDQTFQLQASLDLGMSCNGGLH